MPSRFRVLHRTEYTYEHEMADGFTAAHLLPRWTPTQTVESSELRIVPVPDERDTVFDQLGNTLSLFAVHHPHRSLCVEAELVVAVHVPDVPVESAPWEAVVRAASSARGDDALEVGPYLAHTAATPAAPGLSSLTTEFTPGRPVLEAVRALCGRIHREFRFDPAATDVSTPLADVLAQRHGVCQDFAHVGVAALRSVGVPARYVSGYLETLPPPGQPKLVGVDASHAWCSVWAGECGWVDFDPTNDQMPPRRHITVAWGRDYDDVAPVRGVVIGPPGGQTLGVSVDVTALD
jgi:transglutaminase-like putative cysteine protease